MKKQVFDIISLAPSNKRYFPAYMKKEDWMGEEYVKYTELEIPLGHSRYGGPVIDLPEGVQVPQGMRFAAQLDLSEISKYDVAGRLPKKGQLIFFSDIMSDSGKVLYTTVANENLCRNIIEHEDNFWEGVLIDKVWSDRESWNERFRKPEDNWDKQYVNETGLLWDDFAGSEKSKIFGIFTHCQLEQTEIEQITNADKIVLLQIGENGFNDEGVFSVLIAEKDLEKLNFENCEFYWGQT
ncbi:DUF1963 domain-containing protein [Limibacter armeniacum]|uniref:DUF1963 domain-containing protein n=1 Tax=Limibacter armeniacum TaxID=466084 RepID=UPI002FE61B5A